MVKIACLLIGAVVACYCLPTFAASALVDNNNSVKVTKDTDMPAEYVTAEDLPKKSKARIKGGKFEVKRPHEEWTEYAPGEKPSVFQSPKYDPDHPNRILCYDLAIAWPDNSGTVVTCDINTINRTVKEIVITTAVIGGGVAIFAIANAKGGQGAHGAGNGGLP